MTIRPYEPSDFDACVAAFKGNMPKYFLPEELEDYSNWLLNYAKGIPYKPEGVETYFVAEEDGRLVACGGVFLEKQNNIAGMVWGMVDNRLHRQGIGRRFLLYRIDYIRRECNTCNIKLDTTQHSRPFFEKYGFAVVKYTENGYGEGMHRYDMLFGA
ncbi:GNAT family N-acetyltransferase [Chitinophaga rhizosphaerae]|uniref:GNAT family N-acetyltransferase n=1 Tax=Chitinophaga rhizosphaerae TaxID=1864947 RepID=UPI0013DE8B5F|nr:GNAT family N-acetyltransferase [Chitinophaga rhizosphaerae]